MGSCEDKYSLYAKQLPWIQTALSRKAYEETAPRKPRQHNSHHLSRDCAIPIPKRTNLTPHREFDETKQERLPKTADEAPSVVIGGCGEEGESLSLVDLWCRSPDAKSNNF